MQLADSLYPPAWMLEPWVLHKLQSYIMGERGSLHFPDVL